MSDGVSMRVFLISDYSGTGSKGSPIVTYSASPQATSLVCLSSRVGTEHFVSNVGYHVDPVISFAWCAYPEMIALCPFHRSWTKAMFSSIDSSYRDGVSDMTNEQSQTLMVVANASFRASSGDSQRAVRPKSPVGAVDQKNASCFHHGYSAATTTSLQLRGTNARESSTFARVFFFYET